MSYPERADYRHTPAWLDRAKAEEKRAEGGLVNDAMLGSRVPSDQVETEGNKIPAIDGQTNDDTAEIEDARSRGRRVHGEGKSSIDPIEDIEDLKRRTGNI